MPAHCWSAAVRLQHLVTLVVAISLAVTGEAVQAQNHPPSSGNRHELRETQHKHADPSDGWTFMQDGMVFVTFNRQAKPMGATELGSQNWWMGMALSLIHI